MEFDRQKIIIASCYKRTLEKKFKHVVFKPGTVWLQTVSLIKAYNRLVIYEQQLTIDNKNWKLGDANLQLQEMPANLSVYNGTEDKL